MVWLPGGKKIDDMFIRFETTDKRDRHTDTMTTGGAYASGGKNDSPHMISYWWVVIASQLG